MEAKHRQVSFKVTQQEAAIIIRIAQRAHNMAAGAHFDYPVMDADMDITACHANGNPLRLADLLVTDEFNFAHDVFGIRRHLNRQTGKLENFFSPRYSLPRSTDYTTLVTKARKRERRAALSKSRT